MSVATHEYAALAWKMKKNWWLRGKQSVSLSTIKEESINSCLYSYYLLLYDQAPVPIQAEAFWQSLFCEFCKTHWFSCTPTESIPPVQSEQCGSSLDTESTEMKNQLLNKLIH